MPGITIIFFATISALNIDAVRVYNTRHSSFVQTVYDNSPPNIHTLHHRPLRYFNESYDQLHNIGIKPSPYNPFQIRDQGNGIDDHTQTAHYRDNSLSWPQSPPSTGVQGLDRRKRERRGLADGGVMITQHFTERTVTPGGDISMQCSATGDRPPQFIWERDGLVLTTDSRYALGQLMTSDTSVVSQLNISRVRVEDGGLYSCVARDGEHGAAHENRLDVYGPPYIRALPPIKVQSGDSVNLRCPYYGYPISKIDWEFKGKTITSNNPFQRYKRRKREAPSVNINGVLTLTEVSKEENGADYTCVVSSPSGEMARRAFEVQVIEAPVLDDLLLGNNLQEGQIVNVYCNVRSGDLPIHFEWLKDGKRIPAGLKVVERSSELFSALVIKRVSLEHCGVYTCVASNHVAKVNRSTELYIKVAPRWAEGAEPSNTSLLAGRRAAVHCAATGHPPPRAHWMKRDGLLGTWQPVPELGGGGVGGGVLSLPNGTLVIEEVSPADEGQYSCNLENGVGQPLSRIIWITVNKPVQFPRAALNVSARAGQDAALPCAPRGDAPLRLAWTRRGLPLHSDHRLQVAERHTDAGPVSVLSVPAVQPRDAGRYTCRATNPHGAASFDVYLTVLEPPAPPSELRVSAVSPRSAALSWRAAALSAPADYYTLQYAPAPVLAPHAAHAAPPYYAVWEDAVTVNITRKESEARQSATLAALRPGAAYSARVAAANQAAASAYSAPVHFTTHEEAPGAAPAGVEAAQAEAAGALRVRWQPPPAAAHHGLLLGYHVRAVPHSHGGGGGSGGGEESEARLLKVAAQRGGLQEALLTGLLKNTRYAVSVSAYTSAGAGPYSVPVYQDTREGAPEKAPAAVECTAVSSSSLRAGWRRDAALGALQGYSVLYAADDEPWQNQSTPHTELYLQGLLKYTNYTIKVAAFSGYGVGPYSYPVVCATLQDVPGPPAEIKVLVLSATSLLVSWKKPEQPNGIILYYTIYYKPTSSSGAAASVRAAAGRGWCEVPGLAAGRGYELWAAAATAAGEGAASQRHHRAPADRVVAGVASLGGPLSVGVGSSLLLVCQCVGVPPPRTVWYHNHNIITHHPRFTRNHDDSLLINNIDQSLGGNYTCLAKNLYGSDSVQYSVAVLPLPLAPALRAAPRKRELLVEWDAAPAATAPYAHHAHRASNATNTGKISYSLMWRLRTGPWQEAWPGEAGQGAGEAGGGGGGVVRRVVSGLACGSQYSLRLTATNRVGTSQPSYLDVATLGGPPVPPRDSSWVWRNSSALLVRLAGWDDAGCELSPGAARVHYRRRGTRAWRAVPPAPPAALRDHDEPYGAAWNQALAADCFLIPDLPPGVWHQVRVSAANEAGSATATYDVATTNLDGSPAGPPAEALDLNVVVIALSAALLLLCLLACVYLLHKRRRSGNLTEYRDSITIDNKSESGNLTDNTSHTNLAGNLASLASLAGKEAPDRQDRIYSAPIHMRNNTKHELYEISPYAQFAVGFRTFGHVDNQDAPRARRAPRDPRDPAARHTETSFQVCSESEDSDSLSKSTLKSVPRKTCRPPHHR